MTIEEKAAKWDALAQKIDACYGKESENGEWEEFEDDDEESGDLLRIGELAAIAFGYM